MPEYERESSIEHFSTYPAETRESEPTTTPPANSTAMMVVCQEERFGEEEEEEEWLVGGLSGRERGHLSLF